MLGGLHLKIFSLHLPRLFTHDQVSGYRVQCSNPQVGVSSEGLQVRLCNPLLPSAAWRCSGQASRTLPLPPPWPSSSHSKSHPFCPPEHRLLSQSRSKPACMRQIWVHHLLWFPTDNVLWAGFVPREGAALMASRCKDGTLLAPGLGAALLGQAFPNLSPNPGKAVL